MTSLTIEANPDELTFRPMEATERDLDLFYRCFEANGLSRSMEMLRWQYLQPPANKLLVDLALTPGPDTRLAAIYAVFPVWMRSQGRRVLGVVSLNTLTDEAYRGRGLFLKMAESLYARVAEQGGECVFGFPNGNSAHGFFKRLAWDALDPVPILIRPLRSGYVLRKLKANALSKIFDIPLGSARAPKLPGGYELRTVATPDSEFDSVWEKFATQIGSGAERTGDFLAWRLQRPGVEYEIVGLYNSNKLVGFSVINATLTTDGELVGKLLELIFDPADESAANILVAESLHRLKRRDCTVVWAWNFDHSPGHSAYRSAGFIPLPEKLQTSELHFGARAFTPSPGVDDRANWYVSMLDSDTD